VGCEDNKGGEHGARTSAIVHGALDQSSDSATTIKCQNSQMSSTNNRDQGDPFGPNGSTHVPLCQHMRGSLRPMVRLREESSTQVKPFDDF
jgi:hypothetical protein